MGKNGPCHHCGVTSTPLWRNGPPEKPILCNACGSRWRTKGSLVNYTPLHAREPIELEKNKVVKMKNISCKTKEHKSRKQINVIVESEREMPFSALDQNFIRVLERDASNRSSSGSAISYSESCAHFGATGSAQSNAWDSLVPSKRRSVNHPKSSPVEKLTKDLYSIWHEQQSSNLSGSSDEDLLFERGTPSGLVEIGHGGMLLSYPRSKAVDEESEASSLPLDNKLSSEASFTANSESKRTSLPSMAKLEKSHDHAKRHRFSPDNLNMLGDKNSLLTLPDLKDAKQKQVNGLNRVQSGTHFLRHANLTPLKRPYEAQNQQLKESKGTMRSPKGLYKSSITYLHSTKSSILTPSKSGSKEMLDTANFINSETTYISPRSLFASPTDQNSVLGFAEDSSDQDLLLDVQCVASFPEAELLYHHPCNQKTLSNSSCAESTVIAEEESLCNFPNSNFSCQQLKQNEGELPT